MASNLKSKLFCMSEDGWRSLYSFRDSIKLLFNVDISLKDDAFQYEFKKQLDLERTFLYEDDCEFFEDCLSREDRGTILWHLVLMETDGPLENIEKAKKFSYACFPSNSKFKSITLSLSNSVFEMVHRHSSVIQQSALLKFDPEHLELTIQGHEDSVELTRNKLNMIIKDFSLNQINKRNARHILSVGKEKVSPTDVFQNEPFSKEEIKNNGDGLFHHDSDCNEPDIETDGFDFNPLQSVEQEKHLNISTCSTPHSALHKKLSASSSSAFESDEDNSVVTDVLRDPRKSKLLEHGVKLGYSLEQIQIALEKLGPGCLSEDNLLFELIKIGNKKSESNTDFIDHSIASSLDEISLSPVEYHDDSSQYRKSPVFTEVHDPDASDNLRSIIIDGSNVAMSHGQDRFSCKGIKIAVDWFRRRGHTDIIVFVPQWRKEASRPDNPIDDQHILLELERERIMSFTPARRVQGRRVVSYDDRYILKHAVDVDGIVVSNDVYRDLVRESEEFRKVVEERLLMYTFVKDKFMPPDDPLGRLGPSLDDFLRKVPAVPAPRPQDCPYGKKCTYGNKCRFYHPERGTSFQKSVTETLKEQAIISLQDLASKKSVLTSSEKGKRQKPKLARTKSLVPGEPLPPSFASESDFGTRQKPKLSHSKSLVSQTKTGDYLTAPRLRMEEESLRSYPFSTKEKNEYFTTAPSQKVQKRRKGSTDILQSFSPSPRTSPAPLVEPVMGTSASIQNVTPKCDSLIMSFSHLSVPTAQQLESYSSGHLSVAKKLSDEGSEKNFFEGSKLSSSPPSSLLNDIAAFDGQKDTNQMNIGPKSDMPTQDPVPLDQLIPAQDLIPQTIDKGFLFEHCVDDEPCCGEKSPSASGNYFHSVDSGNYSMQNSSQPIQSPQGFASFPPTYRNESPRQQSHQSLHRSFSSSHSSKGPETYARRSSDAIGMKSNEHMHLSPRQSLPTHPQQQKFQSQLLEPVRMMRQNSSSNPEITDCSNTYDNGHPADSISGALNHPTPISMADARRRSSQGQGQSHHTTSLQPIPMHQASLLFGNEQFHGMAGTNVTQPPPQTDRSFILPSYPQVSPVSRLQADSSNTSSNTSYIPMMQYQHPPPPQAYWSYQGQPRGYSTEPWPSAYQSVQFQGHAVYPPGVNYGTPYDYPPHMAMPSQFPRCVIPPHSQMNQDFLPPNSQATFAGHFDQEAPILPNDSRYQNYQKLKDWLGEKVVRVFMNRNPDVKDINQLINLISAYKVEMGL